MGFQVFGRGLPHQGGHVTARGLGCGPAVQSFGGANLPGLGRGLLKFRSWPALEDVEQIAFGQGFRVVAAMDLRSWHGVQFTPVGHAVEFFGMGFVVNRFAGAHRGLLRLLLSLYVYVLDVLPSAGERHGVEGVEVAVRPFADDDFE